MSEAVREAREEVGPATRLLALYAEGGEVEAAKLTLEMIAESVGWLENEDGERAIGIVRRWWVRQVEIAVGPDDAVEFDQRWGVALREAKPKAAEGNFGKDLDAAIKARAETKSEAETPLCPEPQLNGVAQLEAQPEPEAEPTTRIMLPALIPPPPLAPLSDWDDAVAAMNGQHAIIENVGGKTVIASWEPSPIDLSRLMVVFQSKESFLLRYSNRSVWFDVPNKRGGGSHSESIALGPWWLGHRDRLQFRGVTFRPGEPKIVHECLNLWQGWGVEAKPGDWGLIRKHIEEALAGGNEEFAEYIVRWIAWSIQNPAAPAEVALVLIGEKGAGKGTLVRCLNGYLARMRFR
jgi:hypothetical protein